RGSSTCTCGRSGRRSIVPSAALPSRPFAGRATAFEMTGWTRLPIRFRLTVTFAVGLALSLAALGAFVYLRTGASLLAAEDAGLSSRAELVAADVRTGGPALTHIEANLIEPDESFAQIADPSRRIIESSPNVSGGSLLPA